MKAVIRGAIVAWTTQQSQARKREEAKGSERKPEEAIELQRNWNWVGTHLLASRHTAANESSRSALRLRCRRRTRHYP